MARGPEFDLARELARPGFTPGARDAAALVELIIAGDEPAATRAAPAVAGLGATGRAAVAVRLPDVEDGAKARLIAVLGLLARAGDGEARARLIAAVSGTSAEAMPRARRAAIVALGKLGAGRDAEDAEALADVRAALIARWDAGGAAADERRSLAEALGKLGGDEALARLVALDAGDDAELVRRRDRAVLM
ncbi:MAG TPA: hypothetical protein VGC42_18775, partial [Kofleriaceae bacterium]